MESRPSNVKLYRCFSVVGEEVLAEVRRFEPFVDGILLDTYNAKTDQVGGTGITHDWKLSRRIVESAHKPVILAGGLTPANVRAAIDQVRPFGVDINSGVKNVRGTKDPAKLAAFITAARVRSTCPAPRPDH